MPRIDVPFVVEKQRITQPTREQLAAGGRNYFYATFKMCEQWDSLTNLKALFVRDGVKPKLMPLVEVDGGFECVIPWEVMAEKGSFNVGIFGGDRLLTGYAYVIVTQGCLVDGEPPAPPTIDWFGMVENCLQELASNKANKEDIFPKEEAKEYIDEQTEIIRSDVSGLQEQINREAHFRGYVSTNAKIQEMPATPNDFAYSAESGTVWVYDAKSGWEETNEKVPDQRTPPSDATPLINGVATPGQSNEYARGDHRHPTDTTRVGFTDYATTDVAGVVKVKNYAHGLSVGPSGTIQVYPAERSDINSKEAIQKPICVSNFDYAVSLGTHQTMSDDYDTSTLKVATACNGIQGQLPVSYDAAKGYVDGIVGEIGTALDELHSYAQSLVSGGAS